jgi:hypothetical protein
MIRKQMLRYHREARCGVALNVLVKLVGSAGDIRQVAERMFNTSCFHAGTAQRIGLKGPLEQGIDKDVEACV